MSLKILLGSAPGAASLKLKNELSRRAVALPDEKFFVIVPEQATLEMQKSVVTAAKGGAVMNIDVVSFVRLAIVALAKTGRSLKAILSDTDKTIIIRRVLKELKEKLFVYAGKINMTGFASQISSVIAEFEEYGINTDTATLMERSAAESYGAVLAAKIGDIRLIFERFKAETEERFDTTEGLLEVFAKAAEGCALIKGSHVYIEGFAGFTFGEYRIIEELLKYCEDVTVALSLPPERVAEHCPDYDLFAYANKTYAKLRAAAEKHNVQFFSESCLAEKTEKKKLFLYKAKTERAEAVFAAKEILRLVKDEGCRFRDIAVLTGDLKSYADIIKSVFNEAKIPVFIDQREGIGRCSLSGFVLSALELSRLSFDHGSVFALLKCGLPIRKEDGALLTEDDIDLLENYCLEFGIRGAGLWRDGFEANSFAKGARYAPRAGGEPGTDALCAADAAQPKWDLDYINKMRAAVWENFGEFYGDTKSARSAEEFSNALLKLLEKSGAKEYLDNLSQELEEEGFLKEAGRYGQLYGAITELIEKTALLLKGKAIGTGEYRDILESGIGEIKLGIIPPSLDCLVAGDIIRSRPGNIKALFVIGASEGRFPAPKPKSALFTDRERDFLGERFEVAPAAREDLFRWNYYLYLAFNRPSERLYITYPLRSIKNEELSPSHILEDLSYLALGFEKPEPAKEPKALWRAEYLRLLSGEVREFESGEGCKESAAQSGEGKIRSQKGGGLGARLREAFKEEPLRVKKIIEAATFCAGQLPIEKEEAKRLYGDTLSGSASRFETFARCPFMHFLKYGIRIFPRPEHTAGAADLGSICHAMLDGYSKELKKRGLDFRNVEDAESVKLANECFDEALKNLPSSDLTDTCRGEARLERYRNIMLLTTDVLRKQAASGSYKPAAFEERCSLELKDGIKITGVTDRIDIFEDGDVFVRIIDYKTGNKKFSYEDICAGTQLQLGLYMSAAVEKAKKNFPEKTVRPGGIYYYHVNDKYTDEEKGAEDKFRMSGLTLLDDSAFFAADKSLSKKQGKSNIVEVTYTSKGAVHGQSKVATDGQFKGLLEFVKEKAESIGESIYEGRIDASPLAGAGRAPCEYCDYTDVCKFEAGHFGTDFKKRSKRGKDDSKNIVFKELTEDK